MRLLLIAGLLGASLAMPCQRAVSQEAIERLAARGGWMMDYRAGQAAARQSGKPLFVVFRCQP